MKKTLLLIAVIAVLFTGLPVNAAKKADVYAVKAIACEYLETSATYNLKAILKYFQPAKYRKDTSYKLPFMAKKNDVQDIIKMMHEDYFYYRIKKATVKGKKATVTVIVRYVDASDMAYDATRDVISEFELQDREPDMDSFCLRFWLKIFDLYRDKENLNMLDIEVKTIKIPFVKRKGTWQIEKLTKSMAQAFDCNMSPSIIDAMY